MKLHLLALGLVIGLGSAACTNTVVIENAIKDYDGMANQIELGATKEDVLGILEPTQAALPSEMRKRPDRFLRDGVKVEIYYFRTAWHDDGLTTDDEFTPYVFHDDRLVAIGWHAIGGPRQVSSPLPDKAMSTQ